MGGVVFKMSMLTLGRWLLNCQCMSTIGDRAKNGQHSLIMTPKSEERAVNLNSFSLQGKILML